MCLPILAVLLLVPLSQGMNCPQQIIYLSDGMTGAMFCLRDGKFTCQIDNSHQPSTHNMRIVNVTSHQLYQMKLSCYEQAADRMRRESWYLSGMYPGTNWCGEGGAGPLGTLQETDACCRNHDGGCGVPSNVVAPSTCPSNSVCTLSQLTRHHCDCDMTFLVCLKNVQESPTSTAEDKAAAKSVGQTYFNSLGQTCYISETYIKVAHDMNFNGRTSLAVRNVWRNVTSFQ